MTSQREFDRLLDVYFDDGRDELADRVIDAALDQIDHIRQRRPVRLPRRFPTMTMPIRVAAAAVIGVLAVGGAYYLSRSPQPSVGPPAPSPSASDARPTTVASAWVTTGAMAAGRVNFPAILLADGRVLVAGGQSSGGATASAELFDPSTGSWSATGPMHGARAYFTATRLLDGRVLVTGSATDQTAAELYDPATGAWTPAASMAFSRGQHMAALLPDGRVLVAGGIQGAAQPTTAELYDPTTDRWTSTGDMVTWRASSSMIVLSNGKVLVAGGFATDSQSAELFDPATGKWAATGRMSMPRVDGQTGTLLADGRVLVTGGAATAVTELYDPATGTWTATGPLATAANGPAATLLGNGTVLVAGGLGVKSDSDALTAAQVYDPASGAWTALAPLHEARVSPQSVLLPDGRALVVGGSTTGAGGSFLTSAEVYAP